MPMAKSGEFEKFADLLGKLAKVPHDEVKAKLEAEKRAKKKSKKKKVSK
jgi:hypothetical protein